MTKYIFTKTVTNVYQYVEEVPEGTNLELYKYSTPLVNKLDKDTLVDIQWDMDVEEYSEA